jgi:hypothetical protein
VIFVLELREGKMNWYKVRAKDEDGKGYTFVGSSQDEPDVLSKRAENGEYVKLGNLVYMDHQGEIKDWSEWDDSVVPVVYINPKSIFSIMQFKGDPRTTPKK